MILISSRNVRAFSLIRLLGSFVQFMIGIRPVVESIRTSQAKIYGLKSLNNKFNFHQKSNLLLNYYTN